MTRHYSTRDFFRQMPKPLLARSFSAREVLQEFDFAAMKETKIDALFDAWMELPEAARVRMESELREICDMACAVGTQAILDEAEFHLDDENLAELRERLMVFFRGRTGRVAKWFARPDEGDRPAGALDARRFRHLPGL